MISTLYVTESPTVWAPDNLAEETVLAEGVRPGEIILYLWQNDRTVVIGRNQNAWKECRCAKLEEDGGTLVRRLSGGGAVYHDLGNLNVSFLVSREDEDIPQQTGVILNALKGLGIKAERTGRNDLTADGRKFSGHACWRQGGVSCHHATVMLRVDGEALEKYLNVSPLKLRSRGVDSVRARVTNLEEMDPRLSIPALKDALKNAFQEEYGLPAEPFPRVEGPKRPARGRYEDLKKQFSSWEWTYGRRIPFDLEDQKRFPWGEADLVLKVEEGRIRDIRCYTDAMDPLWTGEMEEALRGVRFVPEDIRAALALLPGGEDDRMREDLREMLIGMTEK
ncbi:MAG: lipoate--protein ligase [Clostridia bacterium]|nr:lipoate--protein ligase [Clostridia bacterium]